MKKQYHIILLAIAIAVTALSCKKKKPEQPVCRIVKITTPINTHDISYYSDGRVQAISTNGNSVRNFNYSENTIISTTMIDGRVDERSIITLDANGLIVNVRTETNSTGTAWNNNAYEYSGAQRTRRTFTTSSGTTPWVSNYTWTNGNMISASSPDGVTQYEFHLDKPMQVGDYFGTLSDLLQYGQINIFYKNANLIKSTVSSGGSHIQNYDYTFDATGKIIAVNTVSGGANRFTQIEYECQ